MKQKLLKSAIIVMTITLLLRSLGFLREIVLASIYGAGMVTDAFILSFTLPSTILAFIASSASAVFIPQYQKVKGNKSIFTSNIINASAILGLIVSLIFTFKPQPLVYLFASQLDSNTFALASVFLRIMIWSAIPILLAEIYRAYLQLQGAFFQAMIANAFINVSVVIGIVLSYIFQNLTLMAIGSVAGSFLCLSLLISSSHKRGLRYHFYFNLKDNELKTIIRLMGPVILASAISELNQIIDRNFASSLISGTVSSLNYANKVNGLFSALIGSSLVTVLFPQMADLASNRNYESLERYLAGCVKKLVPVVLPIMIGLIVLAKPLIRILFERGAFSPEDTQRTAECLQMYAICFVAANLNPLFIKFFHATQDTKTPAVISAISVGINVLLNFLLIGPLQHRGLAFSTSIAAIAMTVLLIVRMKKTIGSLHFLSDKKEWLKIILSSATMGMIVLIGYRILPVMTGSYFQCVGLTVGLVITAVFVYIVMHVWFHTEFLGDIISQIQEQEIIKKNIIKSRRRNG